MKTVVNGRESMQYSKSRLNFDWQDKKTLALLCIVCLLLYCRFLCRNTLVWIVMRWTQQCGITRVVIVIITVVENVR